MFYCVAIADYMVGVVKTHWCTMGNTLDMSYAVIDWINLKGQTLTPHILCNAKAGRRFHHKHTGVLLYPAGYD